VSSELHVSYAELDDVATRLRDAAEDTASAGSSTPALSSGILGGALASEIVAPLLRQSAHLCLTLETASEALRSTSESYGAVDHGVSARHRGFLEAR